MEIFEEIKKILVEELTIKPEMVRLDSRLREDLGADSLDTMEIATSIEEKLGISISEEEVTKIKLVGDIVALVDQKVRDKLLT